MSLRCYRCSFETNNIRDLCAHLRTFHLLFDSPKLNLPCCAGCPATFKTFNGFKKHLRKCYSDQINSDKLEDNSGTDNNTFEHEENTDFSADSIQSETKNTQDNNNKLIQENVSCYVSKLYSLGLPESSITSILESTSELFFPVLDEVVMLSALHLRKELATKLSQTFENQVIQYRRRKFFEGATVQPLKKSHGVRMDQRYDRQRQRYISTNVTSTFAYVPLMETLRMVLSNTSVQNYFTKEAEKNDSTFTHFIDGEVFQNNFFYHENRNVLQIQIYFDEFEVCNPLGSKKSIHKIGAFYFTLNNLPMYVNSSLENIHILALCYNLDIKEFGIDPVLEVIVDDLRKLETEGIFVDAINTHFKGTLSALSFDNLGGAMLLGMNESFQAHFYCRICTIDKISADTASEANDSLWRTSASFSQYSNQLKYANSDTMLSFGVKHKSAMFNLNYFDVCDNSTVDVMHDFLEGICQRELKLFFEFCFESKIMDLTELNRRVQAFDYGLHNRGNFPSHIYFNKHSNSIGQRAAQTFCLLIHLPLILEDLTPAFESDDYNKCLMILLLIEILKIVIAPSIPRDMLFKLSQLIKEHHELLIQEYSVKLTPKHHLITHYPMIIRKMGPPRGYWTMRFESKNGYCKELVRKLKNFKDVASTLAQRHQTSIFSAWSHNPDLFANTPCLKNFKSQIVESTRYSEIIKTLDIAENSIIYVGKTIQLRGATLILNKFICTSFYNNLPVFGRTLLFFSYENEVYSICEMFRTSKISSSCLGYTVEKSADVSIVKISDLPYTKAWNMYESFTQCVILTDYFL